MLITDMLITGKGIMDIFDVLYIFFCTFKLFCNKYSLVITNQEKKNPNTIKMSNKPYVTTFVKNNEY